jgi:protease I
VHWPCPRSGARRVSKLGQRPRDADALLLPRGALNPDQLRAIPVAVDLVRAIARSGKPVAAICHGPWTLAEADVVRGKRMTSWPPIKTEPMNAGAKWVDEEVVVDGKLVTSRKPADIPAFVREMIQVFARSGATRGKERPVVQNGGC